MSYSKITLDGAIGNGLMDLGLTVCSRLRFDKVASVALKDSGRSSLSIVKRSNFPYESSTKHLKF
ncbi:hypothetical protein T4B_3399 [Trichinella pseudospiralis]|uniref:Uncharacterized protein n=1 Tax=Trichinella pseudospiralis TaxID=6337 RepID=A0A0V1IN20_TRIPS|nr:hypothetical protein T4B_3399 [Trichinella pseudospiralis]KRZ36208.1 hypothetical protein T4C_5237 [Trichinella pseudospiralis]